MFGAKTLDELEKDKVWVRSIAPHMPKAEFKKAGKDANSKAIQEMKLGIWDVD